ncbi:hypothetical protein CAPTEDRAFT_214892 [Capitella teleta]|uniref:Uncharacterized protein n=1 Tax=Capitella teleta TaxID=283909 RepID=R7ULJ5_CAPTE|nr:hypothetical protein CAPTEDRAFT_214892 [Capitella teleta]|eukprot:ELU07055.1 hypothetical protein CAPTEDRAFT_214892 [Capitella teleta]
MAPTASDWGTASAANQTPVLFDTTTDDIESMQNPLRRIQLEENKTSNKTYDASAADIDTSAVTTETAYSPSSTAGYIYLRGHRIRTDALTPRRLTPQRGHGLKPPGAQHKEYMKNAENDCWPQCEDDVRASKRVAEEAGTRSKKEDTARKYQPQVSGSRPSRRFLVWIIAAASLTVGSLVSMSACFAFCYCSDRVRKSREKAAKRRRNSKQGEYERVGSVSSIVSHSVVCDDVTDATVDSVTII